LNRKLILLNLVLITLAGGLFWTLRARRIELQSHERVVLNQRAHAVAVLPPPQSVAPRPVTPAEYIDVAQKMLFTKDRNPTVIIEPPPKKPDPPMPLLPSYHGQMAIGDPVVFLIAEAGSGQKGYRAGDKVGKFELVSFDREKITLTWDGKTIERNLAELRPKEPVPQPAQSPAAAAAARPAATTLAPVKTLGAGESPLGADMGGGFHGCVAGDSAPTGTVKDGYKKVVMQTPFGQSCHWEQVK
jgi:hypothetical protein